MKTALSKAIRVIIHKNSGSFRQQVFKNIASHSNPILAAMIVYNALGKSFLSTWFTALYGIKSWLCVALPKSPSRLLCIYSFKNEERQIQWMAESTGLTPGRIEIGVRNGLRPSNWLAALGRLTRPKKLAQMLRVLHRVNQRHDFLVTTYVASTMFYYARFRELLGDTDCDATLVSSDSSPEAIGLTLAMADRPCARLYVTHGHIPDRPWREDQPPKMHFDAFILDGQAALEIYERSQPVNVPVVFKGVEGADRPLRLEALEKDRLRIGIFASLQTDINKCERVIRGVRRRFNLEHIVLRLHTNKVARHPHIRRLLLSEGIDGGGADRTLQEDIDRCDLVIAGDTSVHLNVLKHGVPTVYVAGMDNVPHDFYGFIRGGLMPAFDSVEAADMDLVRNHYRNGWAEKFRYWDAGYGQDKKAMQREVGLAINKVIEQKRSEEPS